MSSVGSRPKFNLPIPQKKEFASTLDQLSARDISKIEHVLTGPGVEKGFARDEHVSIFVEDKAKLDLHKRGYTLKAKVFNETINSELKATVFDLKNGNYRISYRRNIPGTYLIDVWLVSANKQLIPTVSKKVIVDSEFPYELKYQDHFIHCLDPAKTSIVLEERHNAANSSNTFSFFIQTRNWRGGPIKEGGAKFAASLTYSDKGGEVPVTIVDNHNGTYRANFNATKSGRYRFDLNLVPRKNQIIRAGMPQEVTLITNQQDTRIDAKFTAVDKNLLRGKRVNDLITILIQAKDKLGSNILVGGGSFIAYINGPAGVGDFKLQVIDNEDGTYTSTFKARSIGNYNLSVKFCDQEDGNSLQHLHGSPFTFTVAAMEFDLIPSLTDASGPGLVGGQTGKFTHFTVTPRNKRSEVLRDGGAQLFIKITYGLAVKEIYAEIRDNKDGTYHVSYCPKYHGRHKIYIYLVDDKGKRLPINGSPFVVDIDPPTHLPAAAYSSAFGLGLQMCKILRETKFFIQARNNSRQEIAVKSSDFTGYIVGNNRKQLPVTLSENPDGTLTASYVVPTPGSYRCYILLQETEDAIFENVEDRYISGVPFTIEALDVVDITRCKVSNLDSEAQYLLGDSTTFTIDAKNREGEALITGGEQFDVIIQSPKGPIPSNIYDKSDGTYDVTFVPKVVGIHKIWVSHEGRDFVGCPYIIDVDEAADSEQSSTVQYMFVVQMRTKKGENKTTGGDFFEVTVTGPDGPVDDVHVIDVGDGSVLVKYSLFKPAEYWVKVTLNGKTLKGFPFLHIMPQLERGQIE